MAKLIRMVWDCPACGKTGIVSTSRTCSCGYVFGTDAKDKFRMPAEGEEVVTVEGTADPDELIENWRCDFCGSYNKHSDLVCTTCGHPRDESAKSYFTVTGTDKSERSEEMASGDVYEESENIYENQSMTSKEIDDAVHKKTGRKTFDEIAEETRRKEAARREQEARKREDASQSGSIQTSGRSSGGGLFRILLVLAAVAAIGFLAFYFFSPKRSTITVSEKSWDRSIDIEEIKTFSESDWSLPDQARLLRTEREIRTYRQEIDHYRTVQVTKYRDVPHEEVYYEDLGNGNAEERTRIYYTQEAYTEEEEEPVYRSVPVYDTKYYYEIDRYVYSRSVNSSGTGEPYWGDTDLKSGEREGARSEHYYISFEADGNTETIEVPYSGWDSLTVGGEAPVEKSRLGGYHFSSNSN